MTTPQRIASIDIFRGITMLLMIFVNDLAEVHGLPWWNYHLSARANGMTYVDMVFPTFLFIVGMSMPLAIEARLRKGTIGALWAHVAARSAGLLILGIGLANADKCKSISPELWGFLLVLSGILCWLNKSKLRWFGVAGLVILFAIFRRDGGKWLDFSYWEILGIIGWTYLLACLFYIPTRHWKYSPLVWLILCGALSAAKHEYAAFCLLVFCGIVCTQIFLTADFVRSVPERLKAGSLYATILLIGALSLLPFGISKIRATPSWCLFTASAAVMIFSGLYYVCDVRQNTKWAWFARPAGSNTILTYLLPDLYYFGVAVPWLPATFNQGLPGVFKAIAFTAAILAISGLLTRSNIRMRL